MERPKFVPLLIEAVLPQLIGGIDTLLARLAAEGRARGLSKDQSDTVIAMLPPAPQHDVGLLFRSVEDKFLPKNPVEQLKAHGS